MKPVLYVSHSKRGLFYYNDASARYRCIFPAEERISQGDNAHAIHFSQIDKLPLDHYQKIIFHRPQYSFKLWRIIRQLKAKKIECWVDFDDLLFCPELASASAAVQAEKMSASLAKKHAKRYLKALRLFSNCQVSTDELASALAKIHPRNIKVVYNKVPERWAKQAKVISAEKRLEKKIIRYLPGTSHHKHDFAHIEKFLAELLRDHPDYQLNIIGDLEFETAIFPKEQLSRTPFQPYEQLPSLINDSWIIIAPLVDNEFNRCKSGLKFWESGVFGIPVISSPLKDIERFNNKGLCISDNLDDWKDFIQSMENSQNYRIASKQAIEQSSTAFFSSGALAHTLDHALNHRYNYLKMTSEFGPRWPGDIINPTASQHSRLLSFQQIILSTSHHNKGKKECEAVLLSLAAQKIKNDIPPTRHTIIRKFKKLISSPGLFIKDSKYFKVLLSKH